ncbi:hypothetical protein IAR55_006597 [Kwoniella newhampshirensis]|uniref:RRM domain-containing protein n=1 Tax=Kwoniella newhampshirensis TaxID=1651941 RepID=A0AAW0YX82_9TREE
MDPPRVKRYVDQIVVRHPSFYPDHGGPGWYPELQYPTQTRLAVRYNPLLEREVYVQLNAVFLSGLNMDMSKEDVMRVLGNFGVAHEAKIALFQPNKKQPGYRIAIIQFPSARQAEDAMNLVNDNRHVFRSQEFRARYSEVNAKGPNEGSVRDILLVREEFSLTPPHVPTVLSSNQLPFPHPPSATWNAVGYSRNASRGKRKSSEDEPARESSKRSWDLRCDRKRRRTLCDEEISCLPPFFQSNNGDSVTSRWTDQTAKNITISSRQNAVAHLSRTAKANRASRPLIERSDSDHRTDHDSGQRRKFSRWDNPRPYSRGDRSKMRSKGIQTDSSNDEIGEILARNRVEISKGTVAEAKTLDLVNGDKLTPKQVRPLKDDEHDASLPNAVFDHNVESEPSSSSSLDVFPTLTPTTQPPAEASNPCPNIDMKSLRPFAHHFLPAAAYEEPNFVSISSDGDKLLITSTMGTPLVSTDATDTNVSADSPELLLTAIADLTDEQRQVLRIKRVWKLDGRVGEMWKTSRGGLELASLRGSEMEVVGVLDLSAGDGAEVSATSGSKDNAKPIQAEAAIIPDTQECPVAPSPLHVPPSHISQKHL